MKTTDQNKTIPTKMSVKSFLELENFSPEEKNSAKILIQLFEKITKKKCVMWGKIFGFGQYHYVGKSREGEWLATGFALRKNAITVYIIMGPKNYPKLIKELGKCTLSGGSCIYFKKLEDINLKILEKIIKIGFVELSKKWKVK